MKLTVVLILPVEDSIMQMQTMEALLSNELLEGEELIWSGRPTKDGKSMASSPFGLRNVALINLVLGLVLMLAAFIIEILLGDLQAGRMSFLFLPGFLIFIMGGVVMFALAKVARLTLNSTLYAITNRRVVILYGSRYLRVQSFEKQVIKQVQCLEYPDGSGDLTFSCLPVYPGVYSSNVGKMGNRCIFRAIPNVHLAEQKLLGLMGQ